MRWVVADLLHDGVAEAPRRDMAVAVEGGRIAALCPAAEAPAGAPRFAVVAPGFIDLQINGGGGVLFNHAPEAATVARIARAARRGGTAHLMPTFITDAGTRYVQAIAAVAAARAAGVPGILGVHLEGPFLSPARPGIHPAHHIRPLVPEDVALLRAAPCPVLLTLAPEAQPPALVAELAAAGVILFAGHSEASFEEMGAAAARGVRGVTHLFNAMSQLQGRAPGVVGAALTDPRLAAGIIADGHHVHPGNLGLAARAMGGRLFLVTDAMATLASDLAGFDLFGVPVRLEAGRLVSPEGTLAGAHLAMDEAVRGMVARAGLSLGRALAMASGNAARAIGLADELGRIAPGWRASLTCLDEALHARAVMIDGEWPDGAGAAPA
jgi:N-acetylglucosamine-6-phosphate deacetylase